MKYEYENFYLNSKSLFDQIIDIWILNYYSNPKISISIWKSINWS